MIMNSMFSWPRGPKIDPATGEISYIKIEAFLIMQEDKRKRNLFVQGRGVISNIKIEAFLKVSIFGSGTTLKIKTSRT